MNKKKTVVLALLLVVVVVLTSCLFYACDPANNQAPEEEEIEATEGLLIQNGDFKLIDREKSEYPRSANNWSGSKMYSSSSFRDDVIAGVISLDGTLYGENKSLWDDADEALRQKLTVGGHGDKDDENKNILMVYQPELSKDSNDKDQHGPTAYGFTSASFTLSKGSYYKLSVDVLTYKIAGAKRDDGQQVETSEPGARIYVSSNTYAEFAAIDTDGEWKTYEIYIETSPVSTTSLTVQLGLGKYTASYTDGLTTGYAFFDNLSLKKIVNADENPDIKDDDVANFTTEGEPAALFAQKVAEEAEHTPQVATTTLKVPNGHFDFGSYTLSSTGVPNSWTHVTGNSGKDDAAPTGLGYNALIDTSKFAENYTKYASNYRTRPNETETSDRLYNPANYLSTIADKINDYDHVGKNVFMLSQQLMTAQGIRSSRTITIEKGKTYALSIDLYAVSIRGAGVSLVLSGTDGKDITIKGIESNPLSGVYLGGIKLENPSTGYGAGESEDGKSSAGWTTYTFYIRGNDFKDYSYNFAIWLGTDGTGKNNAVTYRNFSQNSNATTYYANGTFSTGWLFIDELVLSEIAESEFPNPDADETIGKVDSDNTLDLTDNANMRGAIVDLTSEDNALADYLTASGGDSTKPDAVESMGSGAPTDWTSHYDLEDSNNPRIESFVSEGVVNIETKELFNGKGTYPELPYANMPNPKAYSIYASQDSYYEVETKSITIAANKFYRISFWLKTVDVKETSGAYVYVLNKTAQSENEADGKGDDEVVITSLTRINTADYDEYLNDWVEINLVIRGAVKQSTDIAIKLTLGTGNRWATTTLTSGSLYVTNFNMATLTYANFTGTSSSTYTKTCDLSSSNTYQFTNGSFDNYDLDDENLDDSKSYLSEQDVPAAPESWTISDSTLEMNSADSNLYAGIVQLTEDKAEEGADPFPENFFFSVSNQITKATGISDEEYFNNFYGNKNSVDYYNEANMKSIAGPNMLALGSKADPDTENIDEKFAVGFSSTSFTLSANTYNVLSLYAKTYGKTKASIFLTGEASGAGENSIGYKFTIDNTANSEWTKYIFFIKVGRNSVSLKLNLWLGEDVQYIADETEDNEEEYQQAVNNAKSAGHVFFDNISSYTLADEDKFDEAYELEQSNGSNVSKLSFDKDSFNPLSSSVESHRTLSSPNGWSGAAGTNQSSSNTKSGILYTGDTSFFESKEVDGVPYVGLLGKDYTRENSDIVVTDEEITAYKQDHPDLQDEDNSKITSLIIDERITELKKNNWLPVEQVSGSFKAHTGDHMLVINNMTKSAYTYTSSTNTLKAGTCYKVSVFVRTYGLNNIGNDDDFKDITVSAEEVEAAKANSAYAGLSPDEIEAKLLAQRAAELRAEKEIGAYIELYLGSANETGKEFTFKAVECEGDWTEYSFYVQTLDEDVTSVTMRLSLGRYITKDVDGKSITNGLTTGYAMFDDISFTEISDEEFAEKQELLDPENENYDEAFAKTNMARKVTSSSSGTPTDPEAPTETPSGKFNLEYLWWMIPTIVLGLVIIVVLIVFVIRKIRKATPKTVKIKKSPASSTAAQTLDEKHDRYDTDKD